MCKKHTIFNTFPSNLQSSEQTVTSRISSSLLFHLVVWGTKGWLRIPVSSKRGSHWIIVATFHCPLLPGRDVFVHFIGRVSVWMIMVLGLFMGVPFLILHIPKKNWWDIGSLIAQQSTIVHQNCVARKRSIWSEHTCLCSLWACSWECSSACPWEWDESWLCPPLCCKIKNEWDGVRAGYYYFQLFPKIEKKISSRLFQKLKKIRLLSKLSKLKKTYIFWLLVRVFMIMAGRFIFMCVFVAMIVPFISPVMTFVVTVARSASEKHRIGIEK